MSKTISRFMAILLSVAMLIALTIASGADDAQASVSNVGINVVSGRWSDDYIGKVELKFSSTANMVGDGTLVVISLNSEDNVIKELSLDNSSVSVKGNNICIEFDFDRNVEHSDTYIFSICEGAFTARDSSPNAGYVFSVTGNELVEDIDTEEIAVTPVQRIIEWLESLNKLWLKPVILILTWFTKL